jgi:type II secretory pathway component GspD/PulD (secretin)
VPILSELTIIGGLFGSGARRTSETELYLFLTPTNSQDRRGCRQRDNAKAAEGSSALCADGFPRSQDAPSEMRVAAFGQDDSPAKQLGKVANSVNH